MNHLDNSKHQQSNVDDRLKKKVETGKAMKKEREKKRKMDDGGMYISIDRMSASSSGTKNRCFQKWKQPNFNAKIACSSKNISATELPLKLIVSPKCNSYWFQ